MEDRVVTGRKIAYPMTVFYYLYEIDLNWLFVFVVVMTTAVNGGKKVFNEQPNALLNDVFVTL